MNEVTKFLCVVAYFVSIIFLPWWFSVMIAIVLLSMWKAYVSVILGALMLDVLFGSSLAFRGFAYLYTAVFSLLVVLAFFLNRAMLE